MVKRHVPQGVTHVHKKLRASPAGTTVAGAGRRAGVQ